MRGRFNFQALAPMPVFPAGHPPRDGGDAAIPPTK
jgi:hypothetical protein